jgi:hypothetical protein
MIISYTEILQQQMEVHENECILQVFGSPHHSHVLQELWDSLCEKYQYQLEPVKKEYLNWLTVIKSYVEEVVHVC